MANGPIVIETRTPRPRSQSWQIAHDWNDHDDQKAVIELLAKRRGLHASLLQKQVPHGRYLKLQFNDGSNADIVLDQGFGAWRPPRGVTVRFDFNLDPATQAERLATMNLLVSRVCLGTTYIVAAKSVS